MIIPKEFLKETLKYKDERFKTGCDYCELEEACSNENNFAWDCIATKNEYYKNTKLHELKEKRF